MARQGNYVSVSGNNPNWAAGISDSLTNLSKSLLSQSEEEKERDRLARKDKQQSLSDLTSGVSTDIERASLAKSREAANKRAEAAEKRAAAKAKQETAEYQRKVDIRSKLDDYDPTNITFEDISTYDPKLAEKIKNASGDSIIREQVSLTEDIFNPTTSPQRVVELSNRYADLTEKYYGKELTPQQKTAISNRVANLGAQVNVPYDQKDREKAISDAYSILGLDVAQKSREDFLGRAPSLLTKDEAKNIHIARLRQQGVPRAEAEAEANAIVEGNYRRKWESDILASRTASAEAENKFAESQREAAKDYMKFQLDLLDDLSSGGSGKSYKPSGDPVKDITTLLKEGGVHENVDEDEMNQLVTRYSTLAQKFSPDIAMAATLRSFSPGVIDDQITSLNTAEQFALDLQSLRGSGTGNKNAALVATARKNLEEALSKDLLTPTRPIGPDMESWRATRWGQRSALPLPQLIR